MTAITYRTRRVTVDDTEYVLRKQVFEGRAALGWRVFRGSDYLGEMHRMDQGFHKGRWFSGGYSSSNAVGHSIPTAVRTLADRFDSKEK